MNCSGYYSSYLIRHCIQVEAINDYQFLQLSIFFNLYLCYIINPYIHTFLHNYLNTCTYIVNNLLSKSYCGSHFNTRTLSGNPFISSVSHFHRTRCGKRAKTFNMASNLFGGKDEPRISDPKLKRITPCLDSDTHRSIF